MDALNFNNFSRNSETEANYRLRNEPVQLRARTLVLDADGKERGSIEIVGEERYKSPVKINASRKRKAAMAAVPRATITVVKEKRPVDPAVAIATFEGKTGADVEVARLEARVKELLGIVRRKDDAEVRRLQSIERLEGLFNRKRLK